MSLENHVPSYVIGVYIIETFHDYKVPILSIPMLQDFIL